MKLIAKTMEGIKEHKEYEKLYLQSVKDYNFFTSAYGKYVSRYVAKWPPNSMRRRG